jgi:hypothetical protein
MKTVDYSKSLYEVCLNDGEDFANAMSSFLNGLGMDKQKKFIEVMGRDHCALQQRFTSVCVDWIKHLAQKKFYLSQMDNSVEFAKEVMEKIHPDKMLMPLI